MKTKLLPLALIGSMALSACMEMTPSEKNELGGALAGAAVGVITAKALGANSNWTIITALAGAAAGSMVAKNAKTNECAYARGDGTYYTAPCP
ncbi:MAG: glucose-6-phosphate isomerase [Paracoccaceae bacterium]